MAQIQMDRLLEAAVTRGASDIHLRVGAQPAFRINGELMRLATEPLTAEMAVSAVRQIAQERQQVELAEKHATNFALNFRDNTARFRVNICHEQGQPAMVLRRLPNVILTPDQVGFPVQFLKLASRSKGLLLVTGATGSGKTTTLASLIRHILDTTAQNVITIEEPTEYRLEHGKRSMIMQREVPGDCPTFYDGLRDALRQDPDVIMIGEMRDLETIEVAVRAAETGHLVLATLHTVGAAKTIDRIIESYPDSKKDEIRALLSTSLLGILSQVLLPRKNGDGRVAAFEYLAMTSGARNCIREHKTQALNDQIQMGSRVGMTTLDDSLYRLASAGTVDAQEAVAVAHDPDSLAKRLNLH